MAANPALQNASIARSVQSLHSARGIAATVLAVFARWRRLSDMRQQLARLDERTLLDIGFDPEQARREAAKPFWKPYTLAPSSER